VRFPGVVVYLNLAAGAPPATGGTVGSVINHVGFIVQNTQESVAKWKAAGVEVLPGGAGRTDQAFVQTPDGLRIEILEDKNQKFPIQHHHIHFNVPESEIPKIQAWYAGWFGAVPGKRGANIAADIPGANLSFSRADMPQATTKGRVLDHIGFDVKNLEAFTKKLEAAGVKLDRPYTKNAQAGTALAFITDPWGTYIELNERPDAPATTASAR
jgi:catechol 2,3-dioxygenase-like lactoylglutathione lyase family enzyme